MRYCFPFWAIDKHTRYAIYGAGNVGRDYYLAQPFFDWGNMVCWIDNQKKEAFGKALVSLEALDYKCIDAIVIAIVDKNEADKIRQTIRLRNQSVQIIWFDPNDSQTIGHILNWYYDVYRSDRNDKQRSLLKCRFYSLSLEMLFMLIAQVDNYRVIHANEPDEAGVAIYGFECARKRLYPSNKNDRTLKIGYWPGEADAPDMSFLDYAFVCRDIDGGKCFNSRFFYPNDKVIQDRNAFVNSEMMFSRKFCNFIYSNDSHGEGAVIRKVFFSELSKYKHIDSPGKVLHNMDGTLDSREGNWHQTKLEFLKDYKFTIAFENQRADGYTTEKLFDAFEAGSIPIYWGNKKITDEVNDDCFVNCSTYDDDFNMVIKRVIQIDTDPELYMFMLRKSPMKRNYNFNLRKCFNDYWDEMIRQSF